jgi:hypothetical protein
MKENGNKYEMRKRRIRRRSKQTNKQTNRNAKNENAK